MLKKKMIILNSKINQYGYIISEKDIKFGCINCIIICKGKEKSKKFISIVLKEKNINYIRLDGSYYKGGLNKIFLLDKLKRKEKIYKLITKYKKRRYLPLEVKKLKKINLKKIKIKKI
jgi:hypothetical protein